MLYREMNDISEKDKAAIRVDENLYEIKDHGNLEFPIAIYDIVISEMDMQTIRWHWHDEVEMIYVKSGKMEILADDSSTIISAGQGFFLNQNVLHSMHIVKGYDACFTSIVFHPTIMFGYGKTMLASKYLTPIIENRNMKYLWIDANIEDGQSLLAALNLLDTIFKGKETGYELLVKAQLCYVWYLLLQVANVTLPQTADSKRITNDEHRIKTAILFIETHFTEPISLDDVAASIHISKSECCRCFKRVLHLTPFEYLLKYRIFYSIKLMQRRNPDTETIADLATAVGFSNISYFNKVFKKYLNMTPTEYKKKYILSDPIHS